MLCNSPVKIYMKTTFFKHMVHNLRNILLMETKTFLNLVLTIVCIAGRWATQILMLAALKVFVIKFFLSNFFCLLTCCISLSVFLSLSILYADWKMSFSLDLDVAVGQNFLLPRIWHGIHKMQQKFIFSALMLPTSEFIYFI